MANVLQTGALKLPDHMTKGIFEQAQYGSTVAALSGRQPMKFGKTRSMTFSNPKAEFVDESGDKSSNTPAPEFVEVIPYKTQVTMRFSDEVLWADEDYQLGILQELSNKCGPALARALDLGIYHGINPLTGTAAAKIDKHITQTTHSVQLSGDTSLIANLDAAEALVTGIPNGVALDPLLAKKVRALRDKDGRRLYPEFKLATAESDLDGYRVSVSDTVSASQEVSEDTKVRAIVGDFTQIYWGVQREIGVQLIQFGDPDGNGDLQRKNHIALRAELVYGWAIGDLKHFAKIVVTP